jgi:ATP dependent DNA ligase C terminal region
MTARVDAITYSSSTTKMRGTGSEDKICPLSSTFSVNGKSASKRKALCWRLEITGPQNTGGVYQAVCSSPRTGLIPATRRDVFDKIKHLKAPKCPFANLPELAAGRWSQGLTAERMKECVWLRPEVVAQVQFLEWTGADHLRHTKFVALRDDKDPSRVVRERSDGAIDWYRQGRPLKS